MFEKGHNHEETIKNLKVKLRKLEQRNREYSGRLRDFMGERRESQHSIQLLQK